MAWDQPTLQQGIDQAGSPMGLLWKPDASPWKPPVVSDEYAGWAQEQIAWREAVTISDLSYHMSDTFIRGSEALKLLGEVSANNLTSFAIGQAKQFVPVAYDGNLITDGILLRDGEESFVLSGVPAAQNWVAYHAKAGGYSVDIEIDPNREFVPGDPKLFRLQVQGPNAVALVERAFGGPLPETKFFHSAQVELDGMRFRALRHGMAGQPGYEFIGDYAYHDAVKEALFAAGEGLGVVHVGGLSYGTSGVESGWIPSPTPAVYADPRLEGLRQHVGLFSYEGQNPLLGSYYSEKIEDYYASPWELGYGRSVSFDHDFIGRDALLAARDAVTRRKVTLELDPVQAAQLGGSGQYLNEYTRHRVETENGDLIGTTFQAARVAPLGTVLALALVDARCADFGDSVEIVWGSHPGAGAPQGVLDAMPRIRATVRPAPYDDYARTAYRAN